MEMCQSGEGNSGAVGDRTVGVLMDRRGVRMFITARELVRWGMGFVMVVAAFLAGEPFVQAGGGDAVSEPRDDAAGDVQIARLQKDIPGLMNEAGVPGMAVVVLREGK